MICRSFESSRSEQVQRSRLLTVVDQRLTLARFGAVDIYRHFVVLAYQISSAPNS